MAVLPSPVTFQAIPTRGAATRYGNLKYVPGFAPGIPSVETPLIWFPVPRTMLPLNADEKNTPGFAGSIVFWFAVAHVWSPGTPVLQTSRYTRAARFAFHWSIKNPEWLLF